MKFKNENDLNVFDALLVSALNGIISNNYEGYSDDEMCELALSYALKTYELRCKIVYPEVNHE